MCLGVRRNAAQHLTYLYYAADSGDDFMEGQSVVVVGAGPAGTCAAMALANAGASVTVYERRCEDTFVQAEGEPYAIVLEKRALDALLDAGFLDADFHGSTYQPNFPCFFRERACNNNDHVVRYVHTTCHIERSVTSWDSLSIRKGCIAACRQSNILEFIVGPAPASEGTGEAHT